MHKIEIFDRGRKYAFTAPDKWDSMNRKQLLIWCGILRMQLRVVEAFDLVVIFFYKIPHRRLNKLSAAQRSQLRQTLSFLEENTMTNNVLGYIRVFFRKYHGPANKLTNVTIAEWRRTELYYDLWSRTGQLRYLHLLAATLYRPCGRKKQNDIRVDISEITITRRAKLFSWALHPNTLKAVQLFYEGARAYIQRKHPKVYQLNPQEAPLQRANTGLQDWEEKILAYSGDKLGNFNETSETNLYVFLKHMTHRIEEYERLKSR